MRAKFGAIVVAGSGKIGGHVASKNRGGAYFRTKVTPSNPRSTAQLNVRSLFTSLSQAWKGLTEEQRTAWNAAVGLYKRTNIFGDLKEPSGINLFQRLNNNLAQIGEAALSAPPLPSEVPSLFIDGIAAHGDAGTLNISFAPSPAPESCAYVVRASKPMSPGISYSKNQMRVIGFFSGGQESPYAAGSDYVAKYGSLGEAGQKIFVDVTPINTATGQSGTPSSASTIVVVMG
jgi:hypothetical protein